MAEDYRDPYDDEPHASDDAATTHVQQLAALTPAAVRILSAALGHADPLVRCTAAAGVLRAWTTLVRRVPLGPDALHAAIQTDALTACMPKVLATLTRALSGAQPMLQVGAAQVLEEAWIALACLVEEDGEAGWEEDDRGA